MPVYNYRALNRQGKTVRGMIDADSAQLARQRLRAQGLHPIEVDQARRARVRGQSEEPGRWRRVLSIRTGRLGLLADATRQMAVLLSAGLPLVAALTAVQEQADDEDFAGILAHVREEVTGGESLAGALGRHPELFPTDYVQLVRAGEMGGALDEVLTRLADNLEQRRSRRARVMSALAYPAFMTLVGAAVLFFLLSFIIPTLTGLFDNLDAALPWPTRLLLWLSAFLKSYWHLVILGLIFLVGLMIRRLRNVETYRRLEKKIFRLPLVGLLIQKLLLAQALRSLAVMTAGGVNLTTALNVAARGMGRSSYAQALDDAAEMVGQGRSLADGLEASRLFPPIARRMIAVGESSGALTEMLSRVARAYEEETDRALSTLTSLVEPIIILVMGLLVGFVVMAVLLPIFDLSGLVG